MGSETQCEWHLTYKTDEKKPYHVKIKNLDDESSESLKGPEWAVCVWDMSCRDHCYKLMKSLFPKPELSKIKKLDKGCFEK